MIIDKLRFVALAVAFSVSIPVVAQEITITDNCVFTKAVIDDQEKSILAVDGVPAFEIATRSSSEMAKVFLLLKQFNKEALRVMGNKWFKATILSSPSNNQEQFAITTYYDSQSAFQFAPEELTYFRSKNGVMIESLIGINLIGMDTSDLFEIFGEGVRIPTGSGFRYMHNLKDIQYGQSDEKVYFYTENDVVTEIAYEKEQNIHIASGLKSFWGYTPVSDGWCTKAECSYNNVKIRERIPDGEVVGRISVDDGADMAEVMVLEMATIGQRYNWVRIVNKAGLTGWVYGKFVRPGIVGTSYEQCLNNSIEYCKWFAENPNKSALSVEEYTAIDGFNYRTKHYDSCLINYLLDDEGNEVFSSIEYNDVGNGLTDRFCGLYVGADLDAVKNFSDDMKKADAVPFDRYQEIRDFSTLSWVTVDQKHRITIETANGIVSKIIVKAQ